MKKVITFLLLFHITHSLIGQINESKNSAINRFDSIRLSIRRHFTNIQPSYNTDSVRAELDRGPYFTAFKDNYFIGGTTLNNKMTAANSNIKFQLSIRQKLTKSRLPFDSYLFIQFTQKTIWNVLMESLPMYDLNFNPGIGLGHMIVHKNKYVGTAYLLLEHESNGKDGLNSRSWNKVSLGGYYYLTNYSNIQLKAWYPIIDSDNNRDILQYCGLAQVAYSFYTHNRRFNAAIVNTWRSKSFSFNTQLELSYKINHNENQFLFIQFYNGYGEHLLDYNKFKSMLRIGFVIKPEGISIY